MIDETERGPNYQLRDLDDIQSIINGGKFSVRHKTPFLSSLPF